MNSFEIVVDPAAKRDLKKFKRNNPPLFSDLKKLIDTLALHPYQGKALTGNKKGCYSLRENDYRIVYEIYSSQKVIHIIQVGHRKEVYR